MSLSDAVKKLRGKPKTSVSLAILREGQSQLMDFTIERAIIKIESVKFAKMLDKEIGYIRLVEFQKNTTEELLQKMEGLANNNMKGLIIDLRNNPGGLLDVAYEVSSYFLPNGETVVSLKGRIPKQNKTFYSHGKQKYLYLPIVVMVNGGSASASEILAGAIQDNKRGIILGTKSFGKGSVQTVMPLKDGSALKLTTAYYFTPAGRQITDKGIIPDVEVELKNPEELHDQKDGLVKNLQEEKGDSEEKIVIDNQLRSAMDVLKGIIIYTQDKPQGKKG